MESFVIGGITTVLGYLYPAYECYKCVEKKRPDGQHLRFWCQYWMIIALITVLERLGSAFIPFIPMYVEAKLAFFLYLWYSKTRGTTYIYHTFVRPFLADHEEEIDQALSEIQTRGGHFALVYWQRISAYLQSHFLELLQHLASQASKPPTAPPGVLHPGFQVQNNLRDRSQSYATYNRKLQKVYGMSCHKSTYQLRVRCWIRPDKLLLGIERKIQILPLSQTRRSSVSKNSSDSFDASRTVALTVDRSIAKPYVPSCLDSRNSVQLQQVVALNVERWAGVQDSHFHDVNGSVKSPCKMLSFLSC